MAYWGKLCGPRNPPPARSPSGAPGPFRLRAGSLSLPEVFRRPPLASPLGPWGAVGDKKTLQRTYLLHIVRRGKPTGGSALSRRRLQTDILAPGGGCRPGGGAHCRLRSPGSLSDLCLAINSPGGGGPESSPGGVAPPFGTRGAFGSAPQETLAPFPGGGGASDLPHGGGGAGCHQGRGEALSFLPFFCGARPGPGVGSSRVSGSSPAARGACARSGGHYVGTRRGSPGRPFPLRRRASGTGRAPLSRASGDRDRTPDGSVPLRHGGRRLDTHALGGGGKASSRPTRDLGSPGISGAPGTHDPFSLP
ncbi:MAG: hypothetical protein BWY88_00862 [Synergistetes bacterium ADurb.Bin520]|nr:MAG: hypothetical protein BWY88_00862 [Synergistetes bacterium ADurb.Bin520]